MGSEEGKSEVVMIKESVMSGFYIKRGKSIIQHADINNGPALEIIKIGNVLFLYDLDWKGWILGENEKNITFLWIYDAWVWMEWCLGAVEIEKPSTINICFSFIQRLHNLKQNDGNQSLMN